jgi:tetratricopeptide (TPR) repeat protein
MGDQPLCFVLMPFGKKPDPAGGADIDFDRIYEDAIKPGIEDADMMPIRADEEKLGGIIHQTMYERLLVCEFAVADLTTSNANVLYELGIRHAARPRTTLTVYAAQKTLPFDVQPLRTQQYVLGKGNSLSKANAKQLRHRVRDHLRELRKLAHDQSVTDSPLWQYVLRWRPKELALEDVESFREELMAIEQQKQELDSIKTRSKAGESKSEAAADLAGIRERVLAGTTDAGVLTSLMLGYRALSDWTGMIEVYGELPDFLQREAKARQQLAFAYNRRAEERKDAADRERALQILQQLQQEQGPSSETSGLIGRIYKSQWEEARAGGRRFQASGYLKQAIAAYAEGFSTDWRDPYPGINAVTLLDIQGGDAAAEQKRRLLPVVRFAAGQRLRAPAADYWDHATMLEVAVHEDDRDQALDVLGSALAASTEGWQPQSTADNLRMIERARLERGDDVSWLSEIIHELDPQATTGSADPAS